MSTRKAVPMFCGHCFSCWRCLYRDVEAPQGGLSCPVGAIHLHAVPYEPGFNRPCVGVGLLDDQKGTDGRKMGFGKTKLPAPADRGQAALLHSCGLFPQKVSDQLELLAIYICRGSISRIEDGSKCSVLIFRSCLKNNCLCRMRIIMGPNTLIRLISLS